VKKLTDHTQFHGHVMQNVDLLPALLAFAGGTAAIPNTFVGHFSATVSHGLSADSPSNFTSTKISDFPFTVQAMVFSERVMVTFHDDGRSGYVRCFGTDTEFRFADDPPFYSTSVQLPHDLTIRLSLPSFSLFHVLALHGGAAISLTFEKEILFFEKIRPLFNPRIVLFVGLVITFPVIFSCCKAAVQARGSAPKPKTE
jgi:hypothetical protein